MISRHIGLIAIAWLSTLLWTEAVNAALSPNTIVIDGIEVSDVGGLSELMKDGSKIYFGPGIFNTGFEINKNDVLVSGNQTHFKNAAIQGKAVFVVTGNNVTIESIECSEANVADNNGACVRQQGNNLILTDVYLHDSQQGVLQAGGSGSLTVKYSRFKNLGKSGRAHSIYANGDLLHISYSEFYDAKDQAHTIKSRSKKTLIEHSIISSGVGNDSRLIDISNGGELILKNTILHQGVNSVNGQLIGFGLEATGRNREHSIDIHDVIIIGDRARGNQFVLSNSKLPGFNSSIENSVFVGKFSDQQKYRGANNVFFLSRQAAGLTQDSLPTLDYLVVARSGLIK